MTDEARLERRYRRLLAFYPRTFRAEHGEEMLVVLLAGARAGCRRPGMGDTANLLVTAMRVRLRPRAPRSIPAAYWGVRLMVLAAVLELAAAATVLATRGALHRAVARHYPQLSPAHVASLVSAHTASVLVGAPVAAVIWLLLARANDRGRPWARAGALPLAGLTLLSLLVSIGNHAAAFALADLIAGGVLAAVSLCAVGLIVSHSANRHYGGAGGDSGSTLPTWPARADMAALN